MSGISEGHFVEPSADSVQESIAGPAPAHQARLSYLNMIPTTAKEYYGEIGTITFDDWINHTTLWMDQLHIPFDHRAGVATMLLRGTALTFWSQYEEQMGPENWLGFQHIMRGEYDYTDKKTVWDRKVAQFHQEPGEPVTEYSSRFFHEINDFCPRLMTNREKMDIYSQGINSSCRLPEPVPKFHNIYEMRRVYEDYDRTRYITNSPTPSPEAGLIHQAPVDPEEDPDEDPEEDPEEDPDEDPVEHLNEDPI